MDRTTYSLVWSEDELAKLRTIYSQSQSEGMTPDHCSGACANVQAVAITSENGKLHPCLS